MQILGIIGAIIGSAIDDDGKVLEQPPAQTPPIYIRNGYNLSKWVGERILERARARGRKA